MFAKDGKDFIGFEIGLFGVAFVGRVVRGTNLLEVKVVVDIHLGRVVVAFDVVVVVVKFSVKFVGRHR